MKFVAIVLALLTVASPEVINGSVISFKPRQKLTFKQYQLFKAEQTETRDIGTTIVGGVPVSPQFKYGWMVALMRRDYQFCGGSLVSKNLLVTAAHCSILGIPIEQLRVVAHRHDLRRSDQDEAGVSMSVKQIHVHPGFQLRTLENDVAVWELEGGDSLSEFIELDGGSAESQTTDFTVIGWGAIAEGGGSSDELLQVDIPPVDNQQCQQLLRTELPMTMLCAGGVKGKDGCQGDSGGPLISKIADGSKNVLSGIVSWGKGCARENMPGVYTRVASFKAWIESFVKPEPQSPKEDDTRFLFKTQTI